MEDIISKVSKGMGWIPMGSEAEPEVNKEQEAVESEIEKTENEEVVNDAVPVEEQKEVAKEETVESTTKIEKEPEVKEVEKPVESTKYKASEIYNKLDSTVKEKYGMSYSEAQRLKSLDVADLKENGQDVIFFEGAKIEDPEATDREIEYRLKKFDSLFLSKEEKEELIENGDITADRLEALDIEFEGLMRKYSKNITNKQNELDLDIELDGFSTPQEVKDNQPTEQQIKELTDDVSSVVSTYDKETIKIVDKDGTVIQEFDYTIGNEEKTNLQNNMLSPDGLTKFWKGETKEEVLKKLSSAMFYLENKEKIHKSIYDQGRSSGELKTAKEISNISFEDKNKPGKVQSDEYQSMREAFRQANG